jgi:P4 family phage/plasmid primase-like protien
MDKEYRNKGENGRDNQEMQREAAAYIRAGLAAIPVPTAAKNPDRRGWQNERWKEEDIPHQWTNGQGIGILWGAPSENLVDIDCDWPEARIAGKTIMPADPRRTFGRPGSPESHHVVRVKGETPKTDRHYTVPGDGPERRVVELLSTGSQSLVPPSVHSSGEQRQWYSEGPAAELDTEDLKERVADIASAAYLARNWPGQGARHDFVLAACGYVGRRLPRHRAQRVMHAAIKASGDEEGPSRLVDVADTLDKLDSGKPTTGAPTLAAIAPGVAQQLQRWHGWDGERQESTESNHASQEEQGEGHGKGLTVDLAEAILSVTPFAQDAGGRLHYYSKGAYRPGGDRYIAARVKGLLTEWGLLEKWSSYRASEVAKFIGADAPVLWERPPLDEINLENGILDLLSRELRPHSPHWLSTVQIPVRYDSEAECKAWEHQVAATFPEDAQHVAWEIIGDLMQPDRSEKAAIILVGEGDNGKSAFLENVAHLIGRRNRVALSLHRIEADRFAASRLLGRLANICPDLPSSDLASTSMFKAITGSDVITGEYKYGDHFEFVPFSRLIFSANHLPRSQDASYAFFSRWRVIPFDKTFVGSEAISRRELDAKLQDPSELSGVLNKALDALAGLRQRGFTESPSMVEAWQEFRETTDPMAVWLDRATVEDPDAFVVKDVLAKAYNAECSRAGRPTISKKAIAKALRGLRPNVTEGQRMVAGKRSTAWIGIGLRAPEGVASRESRGGDASSSEQRTRRSEEPNDARDARVATDSAYCLQQVKTPGDDVESSDTHNNREKPLQPLQPLRVEEVVSELRRPNSGARINLPLYLAGETTLEILTKSVLVARGISTAAWEEHAVLVERAAADPTIHGVECECQECLL